MSDVERTVHQQILEDIKCMKSGADSIAVGFHEQISREMQDKRGRFSHIKDKKPDEAT